MEGVLNVRMKILAGTALLLAFAVGVPAGEIDVRFAQNDVGKFPSGWKAREAAAEKSYLVRTEGPETYLHAESRGDSFSIGYQISADLERTPRLRFSWRALELPPGGNEREKKTGDSGLGVYVLFESWGIPPKSLKYVWSTTLPVGATTESPYSSRAKILVLRSGAQQVGAWIEEEVNLLEDYRRLFGESVPPKVKGLAVLTDSDNTRTRAVGDYKYFLFSVAASAAPK